MSYSVECGVNVRGGVYSQEQSGYDIATKQIPNSDPKFHHPLIVDGVGKSTRVLCAILNK